MNKQTKGGNPLVTFLLNRAKQEKRMYVLYRQDEDTQGITNKEQAVRRVVEATLAYIKNNKL